MKPAHQNSTTPDDASHLRLIRSPDATPAKQRLVVVGAGMVSQKLCERIEALGLLERFDLTVLGDEPSPAYDRVNLTSVLRGTSLSALHLQPRDWFRGRKIRLHTGDAVEEVDTEHKLVKTASGREVSYDKLVLATGSAPVVPKVDGADVGRVHVYRTAEDADAIEELICAAREAELPVAIVGAGLLGLELAEAMVERNARVIVVEAAERILPKQLAGRAAEHVRNALLDAGYPVLLGTRVRAIERRDAGGVTGHTDPGRPLDVAGVVFATGVRPRDDLARRARIRCDMYGGIEVDDELRTSHPDVFAIGECARHSGVAYGLVAPGYEMAEVLARRLSGDDAWSFRPQQTVTRLKMHVLEVSAVGRSFVEGSDVRTLHYEDAGNMRTLVLEGNTVVGASAVGPWPEFVDISGAIVRADELRPKHLERFTRGVPIWGEGRRRLDLWPDETVVCSCTGVSCGVLRSARDDGCRTSDALTKRTAAGSVCGSCVPTLKLLAGEVSEVDETPPGPALWAAACATLLAVIVVSSAPPIEFSTSFTGGWHVDELWRNKVLKQTSGYSLLALFVLAAAFSLRKRWSRFNLGAIPTWRTVHSMIGASAVSGTVLHTGMRLGHNLDFVLMMTVLAVAAVGAGAALAVAGGSKWSPARAAATRRLFTRLHIWTTWPLPILLAIHVFRAYYF